LILRVDVFEIKVGPVRLKFKNLVPPWLPAPHGPGFPAGTTTHFQTRSTPLFRVRIGDQYYNVHLRQQEKLKYPIQYRGGAAPGGGGASRGAHEPQQPRLVFKRAEDFAASPGDSLSLPPGDAQQEQQADSFRYHGNRYGSAFGKPPPEKPDAPQAGFAIYPAVPLSEHYVTAYAKIPDSQASHLVHGTSLKITLSRRFSSYLSLACRRSYYGNCTVPIVEVLFRFLLSSLFSSYKFNSKISLVK
jgi:hypothetical protein